MNTKTKYLLIFFALILFSSRAFSDEIEFMKGTYSEVLAKAKTENKIVMIDFMTDWCKWCVELDRKVYTDGEVAAFANKNQINWKIDAEKGEGPELAKKYNIQGYPTIVFTDSDGNEIDRIVGYIPAKDFLASIMDFNANRNTFGSLKAALESDPANPEANFRMGRKLYDYGQSNESKPYFVKVVESDPGNNSGWTDDAALMLAQMSGKVEDIEEFVKKYPLSDQLKNAYIYLAETAYQSNNDYDKAGMYFDKAFKKYGREDEDIKFSYGQFLITKLYKLTKDVNATDEDRRKGIEIAVECVECVRGSVNEASVYYYASELYYQLKDIVNANDAIDNALKINDTKNFRKQKEKINSSGDNK